jgi:hypothetical protein
VKQNSPIMPARAAENIKAEQLSWLKKINLQEAISFPGEMNVTELLTDNTKKAIVGVISAQKAGKPEKPIKITCFPVSKNADNTPGTDDLISQRKRHLTRRSSLCRLKIKLSKSYRKNWISI